MPELMTRAKAYETGNARFFTGRPCKRDHVDYRYTTTGHCVACARASNVKFRSPPKGTVNVTILKVPRDFAANLQLLGEWAVRQMWAGKWETFVDPDGGKERLAPWLSRDPEGAFVFHELEPRRVMALTQAERDGYHIDRADWMAAHPVAPEPSMTDRLEGRDVAPIDAEVAAIFGLKP
jgi:hypothetical protein